MWVPCLRADHPVTDDLTARCLAEIDRREAWLNRMHPAYGACERAYLAAFRTILDLHERYVVAERHVSPGTYCIHDDDAWPCQTVRAVATALGGEP